MPHRFAGRQFLTAWRGRRGILAVIVAVVVVIAMTPQACQTILQAVYPDFTYTNSPFPVLTPRVKPGEAVNMEVGRCNRTGHTLRYSVDRYLLDESGISTPLDPLSREVVVGPGCTVAESPVTNVIPPGTPPGTYRLLVVAHIPTAVINATFERTVDAQSQPFVVER